MIASVGATISGSDRSSNRTSPAPYMTAPRITPSLSRLWTPSYPESMLLAAPQRHLMPHPSDGRCSGSTGRPARTASTADQTRRRHRKGVAGPGSVELTAVDEPAAGVEHVIVRRAGGRVGAGDVLALVIEVRERLAVAAGLRHHLIGRSSGRSRRRCWRSRRSRRPFGESRPSSASWSATCLT